MNQFVRVQLQKIAYPYWVIGKIAVLVFGSLVFLHLDQTTRSALKPFRLINKERLRLVD